MRIIGGDSGYATTGVDPSVQQQSRLPRHQHQQQLQEQRRPQRADQRNLETSARFSAQASQSTSAELSLTTADGDKVTLSFSNSSSQAISAGKSEGSFDYSSLRQRSTSVSIEVEGDLSKEELQDIQKLAKILTKAAGEALSGNTEQAQARAAKADKLDSIASFAYSLNQRTEYTYSLSATAAPKTPPKQPAAEA
ncbi:MAG: hypothetical protein IT162_21125 [Bryobacterales bacterium]|nr:hypothetical protein [Bryobacterales bacterium]